MAYAESLVDKKYPQPCPWTLVCHRSVYTGTHDYMWALQTYIKDEAQAVYHGGVLLTVTLLIVGAAPGHCLKNASH